MYEFLEETVIQEASIVIQISERIDELNLSINFFIQISAQINDVKQSIKQMNDTLKKISKWTMDKGPFLLKYKIRVLLYFFLFLVIYN